jgi:hypothetical protein
MTTMVDVSEMFRVLDRLTQIQAEEPTEEEETVGHDDKVQHGSEKSKWVSRVNLTNFFQHPATHPAALDLRLLKKYGPEYLSWEIETLALRIPHDFKTQGVSDLTLHKIEAIRTLHLSSTYWNRWEAFVACTSVFNNYYPDFEVLHVPTVDQCLISCATASYIRDTSNTPRWSAEVKSFIANVFLYAGVLCPLPPCDFIEIDTHGLVIDCAEVSAAWEEAKRNKAISATVSPVVKEQLNRYIAAMVLLETNLVESRYQRRLIEESKDTP